MTDPSSPVIGAHIHAPATKEENASIIVDFENFGSITTSPIIGETLISDQLLLEIIDGLAYVNIHTQRNPAGEIRGQITAKETRSNIMKFTVNLKGKNEVPPVEATFDGKGELVLDVNTRMLSWNIQYGDTQVLKRSHIPEPFDEFTALPTYAKEVIQ